MNDTLKLPVRHGAAVMSALAQPKGGWILFIAAATLFSAGCKKKPPPAPPPPVVEVIEVKGQDVPIYHDWIGTLDGLVNAQIRAQVSGYLLAQNYREGDLVKKGDLMFQIDQRPFQAALDQAKGQLVQAE